MMALKTAVATLMVLLAQPASGFSLRKPPQEERLVVLAMHMYGRDCGRAVAKTSGGSKVPGAGTEPNLIEPYGLVLKDGFYDVDCVADYMFTHGDMFGDHKDEYELGGVSNVSIVHYSAHVAKEDREEMTHEVCFSFCRTVPNMHFFGITNGRGCYCMTYYQAMADDNSLCDEVCDGNKGTMCGGKSKSSIFGMHACDNTASQLSTTEGEMSEVEDHMTALEGQVSQASLGMQSAAAAYQTMFGNAGDSGAAELMQAAKVFAGELEHAAGEAGNISETIGSLKQEVSGTVQADLTNSAALHEAEALLERVEGATAQGAAATVELQRLLAQASPDATGSTNASQKYYPIMYFVDKSFGAVPTTCTGAAAEKPMIGTMDSCAQACDADVHECVGFNYFPPAGSPSESGLCFLISKFETAKYYAGCDGAQDAVKCVVKYAKFDGATLKPDPSGKCDLCLKEAEKADRCYA